MQPNIRPNKKDKTRACKTIRQCNVIEWKTIGDNTTQHNTTQCNPTQYNTRQDKTR